MANKQALRELQQRLAERMQAARDPSTQAAAWLAVECAGVGLLFSLKQAAEIFTPVPLKTVPYAQPWLAGVANLRGGLFTVVDLAMFLGLRDGAAARAELSQTRLVSSGLTSTSRALEPSLGPTTPRLSRMSIRRPALAKPTRSLRWSIEVEPNCVETTSSMACTTRSRSSPMSSSRSRLAAAGAVTSSR